MKYLLIVLSVLLTSEVCAQKSTDVSVVIEYTGDQNFYEGWPCKFNENCFKAKKGYKMVLVAGKVIVHHVDIKEIDAVYAAAQKLPKDRKKYAVYYYDGAGNPIDAEAFKRLGTAEKITKTGGGSDI